LEIEQLRVALQRSEMRTQEHSENSRQQELQCSQLKRSFSLSQAQVRHHVDQVRAADRRIDELDRFRNLSELQAAHLANKFTQEAQVARATAEAMAQQRASYEAEIARLEGLAKQRAASVANTEFQASQLVTGVVAHQQQVLAQENRANATFEDVAVKLRQAEAFAAGVQRSENEQQAAFSRMMAELQARQNAILSETQQQVKLVLSSEAQSKAQLRVELQAAEENHMAA
jgi:hypothetical protein